MANTNSEEGERNCCSSLDDFLRKEARVEVATDEEGFKGVWFEARIVDPPKNPQSDLKDDRLALVEYQTLLSDDGVSLLVEKADSNFIRPSPPPENAKDPLEWNNFVDAFYQDAWWPGVVAAVTENGRYLVTFEDPPDTLELDRADLRIHWEWVGGLWVRPKDCLPQHKQVSEHQRERSLLVEETTLTSRRKRGRPRKVLSDENTKSFKKAAFSPSGEKTNQKGEKISAESEATLKHCTASAEEKRSLPFSKASEVWLAVDSMEAFKKFPQRPHFAPLRQLKEAHREGLAVAHMVTFSTLADKALRLQCSDPKSSFNECLEALSDLECHGFDIKPVEIHIKKMLLKKEHQERLGEKVRNTEERIKELNQANKSFDEEIMDLNQKAKVLESKRDKNKMKLETLRKNLESLRRQMELGLVDDLSSG